MTAWEYFLECFEEKVVGLAEFESATSAMSMLRSNQLSYSPVSMGDTYLATATFSVNEFCGRRIIS